MPRLIHAFFKGVLACLDGYMNIAMEQTEEYVNGQLKNKYGDCFIRGNNGNCCATFVASEARFNRCPMTNHRTQHAQCCTSAPSAERIERQQLASASHAGLKTIAGLRFGNGVETRDRA